MADLTAEQISARLDSLYSMRDSGVLLVRHGDTSTQFRSMDELLQAIRILEGQLGKVQGKTRSRVSYIREKCKGF